MQINSLDRLNVIIVDDEPIACENLRTILLNHVDPNINITAIVNSTEAAILQIRKCKPHALFLDIEMPEENAFHFLERIYPFDFEIIFVTAFDAYAVKAFKLHAIDYILKPISVIEVTEAVDRLREKITYKQLLQHKSAEYKELVTQMTGSKEPQKIFLKEQNNILAVAFTDIYFVEAKGSYSKIYFTKNGIEQQVIMSNSIAEYEELLPASMFFRIHKSYLINCAHLKKVVKHDNALVVINDTYRVPVSRRRYPDMMEFLRNYEFNNI